MNEEGKGSHRADREGRSERWVRAATLSDGAEDAGTVTMCRRKA